MRRERIKICRIQSRISMGGPTHQTALLSARLDPDRFETLLIGGAPEPGERDLSWKARDLGVRMILLPEMRRSIRPIDDLRAFRRLCRIFRRERPQIVHTHTAKAGALGRLAARVCGVPLVIHTFHGHVLSGYFPRPVNRIFQSVEQGLAAHTDRLIAISNGQLRELSARYRIAPPEKFSVVPIGLDLESFARLGGAGGSLRCELGIDRSTPLIGWVGRLVPVKDPFLFLDFCAEVAWTDARPHFVMAGDGPLRKGLEARVERIGLRGRIHFLGYRGGMEEILADLDLLIGTSRNEGTPVAFIEAMAAGVPIASVEAGGVAELLADYPLARTVRSRIPLDLAREAAGLIGKRAEEADRRRIARRFGADRLVRDIEELYESLLLARAVGEGSDRGDRRADAA